MSPVFAEVGPDGAVWFSDWQNYIIQHNPTPSVARGGYDVVFLDIQLAGGSGFDLVSAVTPDAASGVLQPAPPAASVGGATFTLLGSSDRRHAFALPWAAPAPPAPPPPPPPPGPAASSPAPRS